MRHQNQIIQLSEPAQGTVRFLSDQVDAPEGGRRRLVVTLTRAGQFWDPRYGDFEITREQLREMVTNFERNTYGQEIALDIAHQPENGAAGFFRRLFLDENKLRGEVELTDLGLEAIKGRGYRYLSAEFHPNYQDNEQRRHHGTVLLGAGLTVRPVIKHLDPVDPSALQLSEDALGDGPCLVSERFQRVLSQEITSMWERLLKQLRQRLQGYQLSEQHIEQIISAVKALSAMVTEEEAAQKVVDTFEQQGKQLSEALAQGGTGSQGGQEGNELKLDFSGLQDILNGQQQSASVSEEQVRKILQEERATEEKKLAERQQALETNQGVFDKVLEDSKLEEQDRKQLSSARDLVTADMSEEQVRRLAEHQVQLGEQIAASRRLSSMGFQQVSGSPRVEPGDQDSVRKLQEHVDENLRRSGAIRMSDSQQTNPFVARVLAEFDRRHAHQLERESMALSGDGSVSIGNTELPASYQRTVIREALADTNVLELLNTMTDSSTQETIKIPYEERDTSAVVNNGITYERQGIRSAGVRQKMDLAYTVPAKIALEITNEVMHFTRNNSMIDWDAFARNVSSNARLMRELVAKRAANEMQRASDSYMADKVEDEDVASQLDGSTHVIKTEHYPVVRPHQTRDLQGNAVGDPEHPVKVSIGGEDLSEFDGTGEQESGDYWYLANPNLGYIHIVNEKGDPVEKDAASATVSYSRVRNIATFDLDKPDEVLLSRHLDGLLQKVGSRRAIMSGERFVRPDFLLMSPVLNDTATNAEQFAASMRRDGAGTGSDGDLERIKGIPAWGTNAPGIDLGDERILMGERGAATYGVTRPFETGDVFEAVNDKGRPIGVKQAYGEEYSTIHVPKPLRQRFTSVLVYSKGSR